ncbi:MAG: hypothetical protein H6551_06060 [Chitinophagales bacterium]|nr:hypothetical protein [Chitinophagales bacterium]
MDNKSIDKWIENDDVNTTELQEALMDYAMVVVSVLLTNWISNGEQIDEICEIRKKGTMETDQ